MAIVNPFCAVRAHRDKVALVSSRSYEAYSPAELGAQLDFNPFSFLHIISPNYRDLTELSNDQRFEMIKDKYQEFKADDYLVKDKTPGYYLYKKVTPNFECIGIIAATSAQDYENNVIKKHENTLEKREILFEHYLECVGFNAEPVLLTYPDNAQISTVYDKYQQQRAEYEFTTENFITHYLWLINDPLDIACIQTEFAQMEAIYIADGHHRSASSYRLAMEIDKKETVRNSDAPHQFFMSFLIPESQLLIGEYNRLIKDLNGHSQLEFLKLLEKDFRVQDRGSALYQPSKKHHFSLYLNGTFYSLYLRKDKFDLSNPLADLDTHILFEHILKPILGIFDLRNDKRLHYAHSDHGVIHLKNNVDSGKFELAFGLFPISINQMKAVADADLKMPPKSTYIRPKLRSGLTIYEF